MLLSICPLARAQGQRDQKTNTLGMSFVNIPEGEFSMGTSRSLVEISNLTKIYGGQDRLLHAENPRHSVRISSFNLQTTEVTQSQWTNVMGTQPWHGKHSFVKEGPLFPAQYVTWNDAVEYCKKLGETDGSVYRLPTEAEWEYACRASTEALFAFGDDAAELKDFGWFDGNAHAIRESYAHRTARRKPNRWGLYDMHGNMWEWCSDRYQADYYSESPALDPSGPQRGNKRVVRGGSWRDNDFVARSACRVGHDPEHCDMNVGFRVVWVRSSDDQDGN
ncbi:MAG: formylglycine-generating enzyme family protein [Rhodothermales bacterium]|nr:formylglycine-generating enzyme family protein [Rhodothermales bacterium]